MRLFQFSRLHVSAVMILFLAMACKGPETTVVRQSPITTTSDTTETEETTASEPSAAFRQINVGEINRIPTLDPLFAENASTMRALQLVYEGLVRFNEDAEIVPAVARAWSLSEDSLLYRFTLRNDIYYHDSDAFSSGIGRKLKAADVKFAFERMARIDVPGHAAGLFMSIQGFEPYYREQHEVFNPSKRVLSGINGIRVPNDTTVVFSLVEKDAHFLQKLASPYALIYPREAITDNGPGQFKTVGTGPFQLSRSRGDSVYIFSRFNNYHSSEQPVLNRIDVTVKKSESGLFRDFATGDIHVLPELGLQTMQGALNENGELTSSYSDLYRLLKPTGHTYYRLNVNPNADLDQQKARSIAQLFDSTSTFSKLPKGMIPFESYALNDEEMSLSAGDTLNMTNTEDSYARQFRVMLRDVLQQEGVTLRVFDIFTATRNIGLFTDLQLPFFPGATLKTTENTVVGFRVPHRTLVNRDVADIHFNALPWWMDMRTATTTTEAQ